MKRTDTIEADAFAQCDLCGEVMEPTGWMPKPDGRGGLQRVIVLRCPGCGRLYDELWGYRLGTGNL